MKAGARNQIVGTVKSVQKDGIMSLVKVDVPAGVLLSSAMTVESLEDLALNPGDKVKVVVKAIHVLLIKE